MAEAIREAFVCGHPIAHSRSPKIHQYWLAAHGLSGSYEAVDVTPTDFPSFLKGLAAQGYVGGNVTIPHKEVAYSQAQDLDDAAHAIGAANTLWFENGQLIAGNTDAYGFVANLDERAPGWDNRRDSAIVLGAGGAARAIVYALRQRGYGNINIVNRTVDRAKALVDRFGHESSAHGLENLERLLRRASLLVNTTPVGMAGHDQLPDLPDMSLLPDHAVVTDLVYVPLETPILKAARQRGLRIVDGLGMLLHQAVPGFERWFGIRPTVTAELRRLIVDDIASGGR